MNNEIDKRKEILYSAFKDEKTFEIQEENQKKDSVFLYISAFTANLIIFSSGCCLTWTSPVIPSLKSNDPTINPLGQPITSMQESWLAAILCLGGAIGPLFAGKSADALGRKKTLLLLAFPMALSFLTLAFASNINLFYFARIVMGMGMGSTFAILPMYLGEITQDHNRGKFGCLMAVFLTLGLLYPFAVGPLLSVKLFSFSCAIPLMIFIIFFLIFIPESPVYLLLKNDRRTAELALSKLRGTNVGNVMKEVEEIVKNLEKDEGANKGGLKEIFNGPSLRRGLAVSLGLVTVQQLSGINAIQAFMGTIFDAAGSGITSYVSTNIVGVIQVFSSLIAALVVEKLGRKFLLLVSAIGCCVSIIVLGLYFFLKTSTLYNVDSIFWLPVVCLIVYIVAFNTGLGPLPWTIMAEIFPSNVKSISSALSSGTCFLMAFIVTMGFPIVKESLGMAQCFWLFGSCCVLGIVFIFSVVPETKGKSLGEIQELLAKG